MRLAISLLMRFIGYVCVASVLSAILGIIYLFQTGSLNNEKLFRIVASLQDVDLESVMNPKEDEQKELPKEPSLDALLHERALRDRDYELKADQLQRQISEFKHMRNLLTVEMERRDMVAKSLDTRLAQAEGDAIESGKAQVARHLNQMRAQQVKDEMVLMIERNEEEKVVSLLGQLSEGQLKKVLQQFRTDPDLQQLYEKIHALMLQGFPQKRVIDQAKNELQSIENQ